MDGINEIKQHKSYIYDNSNNEQEYFIKSNRMTSWDIVAQSILNQSIKKINTDQIRNPVPLKEIQLKKISNKKFQFRTSQSQKEKPLFTQNDITFKQFRRKSCLCNECGSMAHKDRNWPIQYEIAQHRFVRLTSKLISVINQKNLNVAKCEEKIQNDIKNAKSKFLNRRNSMQTLNINSDQVETDLLIKLDEEFNTQSARIKKRQISLPQFNVYMRKTQGLQILPLRLRNIPNSSKEHTQLKSPSIQLCSPPLLQFQDQVYFNNRKLICPSKSNQQSGFIKSQQNLRSIYLPEFDKTNNKQPRSKISQRSNIQSHYSNQNDQALPKKEQIFTKESMFQAAKTMAFDNHRTLVKSQKYFLNYRFNTKIKNEQFV